MKIDQFWAGTEQALAEYMLFVRAHAKDAFSYQTQPENLEEGSRLLTKQGTVGVISISGSLNNGSRGYGSYTTTYGEIRQALIQASADPQIKTILLDIKSGGGSVQGLSDTADLVRKVDSKVKPVHAFSDSAMASAAYWLGSSARKVHASNMAEVGSIGVIATHMEYTKMLESEGITPTVIRSGEFKGLGTPYERLSEKAQATIQAQLDHMAGIFDNYIADRRGMSVEAFKKRAGEGRVFVGQQGVDAGLVDSITTFDALVSKLEEQGTRAAQATTQQGWARPGAKPVAAAAALAMAGGIDLAEKAAQSGSQSTKGPDMPQALTDQTIAALAEGAPSASTGALAAVHTTEATVPTNADTPPAAEGSEVEPAAQAPADNTAVVAFLQAELSKAQAQVVDLTVNLRAAQASAEAATKSAAGFKAIAQASVDRMRVALSMPSGVAASSDEALLAEHAELRGKFEASFKPGGVAAVSSAPNQTTAGRAEPSPVHLARIQATRPK